jgi:hypothetical protein
MKRLAFAIALLSLPAFADDLDDGSVICKQHEHMPVISPGVIVPMAAKVPTYDSGWDHCAEIVRQWTERKMAADALDEAKNADLKKTRDLAKGLKK